MFIFEVVESLSNKLPGVPRHHDSQSSYQGLHGEISGRELVMTTNRCMRDVVNAIIRLCIFEEVQHHGLSL